MEQSTRVPWYSVWKMCISIFSLTIEQPLVSVQFYLSFIRLKQRASLLVHGGARVN